jgi:hypothetical protein
VPEAQQNRANAFGKASLFSGLSERELGYLLDRVVPRSYSSGEIVFSEGELCAGLYVVESGSIRIFKSSSGGREQVLSIEGPAIRCRIAGFRRRKLPCVRNRNPGYRASVCKQAGYPGTLPGSS